MLFHLLETHLNLSRDFTGKRKRIWISKSSVSPTSSALVVVLVLPSAVATLVLAPAPAVVLALLDRLIIMITKPYTKFM
ncbi:unnamed protein product [Coffea canephora]|uniref:Uncharacterized protein n=1 Tax=Coffea canephora TaxID=49390 RepID=A0A068U3Q0_COFCA|nr:unnamed protein product [Coffea canephora]